MQSKSGTTYFFFQSKTADKQHGGFLEMDTSHSGVGWVQTAQASEQLLFSVQFKQSLCSPWWVVL